jgi:hypothetical protein
MASKFNESAVIRREIAITAKPKNDNQPPQSLMQTYEIPLLVDIEQYVLEYLHAVVPKYIALLLWVIPMPGTPYTSMTSDKISLHIAEYVPVFMQ